MQVIQSEVFPNFCSYYITIFSAQADAMTMYVPVEQVLTSKRAVKNNLRKLLKTQYKPARVKKKTTTGN